MLQFLINNQLDEKTETIIRNIIGATIEVHRELGPGYLEKVYEQAMTFELKPSWLFCYTSTRYSLLQG